MSKQAYWGMRTKRNVFKCRGMFYKGQGGGEVFPFIVFKRIVLRKSMATRVFERGQNKKALKSTNLM